MKSCCRSSLILIQLIHFTILPVFGAKEAIVEPEVTAYLGQDVTLPCHFSGKVTQVNWELKQPDKKQFPVIVSHPDYGVTAHDTFLKERVKMTEQSLTIRNVEMRDAGLYTCTIHTPIDGSLKGETTLRVQEQKPLSSGTVAAIVTVTILLLVMMAGVAYHVCIRRAKSTVRHRVYIDTDGPVMDKYRPSVLVKNEDVVYADVKPKRSRRATPSSGNKPPEATTADDVTYSDIVVLHRQP